jgi:hypothetical protein
MEADQVDGFLIDWMHSGESALKRRFGLEQVLGLFTGITCLPGSGKQQQTLGQRMMG